MNWPLKKKMIYKEDDIYQTLDQLHEQRKHVARLHKQGIEVMQIVSMTGLSHPTVSATIALCNGAPSWVPGQGKASAARKERVLLVLRSTGTLGGLLTDQRTLVFDEGAHFYSCRQLTVEHALSAGRVCH